MYFALFIQSLPFFSTRYCFATLLSIKLDVDVELHSYPSPQILPHVTNHSPHGKRSHACFLEVYPSPASPQNATRNPSQQILSNLYVGNDSSPFKMQNPRKSFPTIFFYISLFFMLFSFIYIFVIFFLFPLNFFPYSHQKTKKQKNKNKKKKNLEILPQSEKIVPQRLRRIIEESTPLGRMRFWGGKIQKFAENGWFWPFFLLTGGIWGQRFQGANAPLLDAVTAWFFYLSKNHFVFIGFLDLFSIGFSTRGLKTGILKHNLQLPQSQRVLWLFLEPLWSLKIFNIILCLKGHWTNIISTGSLFLYI